MGAQRHRPNLGLPALALIAIFLILVVCMKTSEETGLYCSLLASVYLILYIGIIRIQRYMKSVTAFFISVLTCIRYFIIPLLIAFDNGYLSYSPLESGENGLYFVDGIVFTIWEATLFGFFLLLTLPKWYQEQHFSTSLIEVGEESLTQIPVSLLVMGILLLCCLVMTNTSVLSGFSFVFSLSSDNGDVEETISASAPIIPYMAARILRLTIPIPFVCIFYRKYCIGKNRMYFWLSAFILAGFYALIIEGNSRNSVVIPAVALIFILIKLYPKERNKVWILGSLLVVSISIILLVWKTFSNNIDTLQSSTRSYWITYLEQYFAGVSNMGKAVAAKRAYGFRFNPAIAFNDLFQNVPILSKFVDPNNSSNAFYFAEWGRHDQVIPASGNGLFIFGYILAPTVPMMITKIAFWFEKQMRSAKDVPSYIIYIYAAATVGYNIFTSISSLMMKLSIYVLPIMLLIVLNRKVRI